jgi:hypothetical protein
MMNPARTRKFWQPQQGISVSSIAHYSGLDRKTMQQVQQVQA